MSFGTAFLTDPGASAEIALSLPVEGGSARLATPAGSFSIRGLSEPQHQVLAARYCHPNQFERVVDDSPPGSNPHLEVHTGNARAFLPHPGGAEEYTLDLSRGRERVLVAGRGFFANLRVGFDAGPSVLWTRGEDPDEFLMAFENTVRTLLAYRVLEEGGLLLHSSAVVGPNDQVSLFLGPSGAGKTTVARAALRVGMTVLSDDLNVALSSQPPTVAEFEAAALPFAGELGPQNISPDSRFELSRLVFLEQAKTNSVHSVSVGEAVAKLASCAPFINTDRYRAGRLLDRCEALARSAKCVRLAFRRQADFWDELGKVS